MMTAASAFGPPTDEAMNTITEETTEYAPEPAPVDWGAVIGLHAAVTAVIAFVVTVIWGVTGAGYFWPMWVWHGIALPLGVHYAVYKAMTAPDRNLFRLNVGLTAVAEAAIFSVWLLSGAHGSWIVWPMLGLLVFPGAQLLFERTIPRIHREQELEERVDELTRTRRGALDVQAAELRRIERDLHDGAQARLVALSMKLGRAEDRLSGEHPELAELVREARGDAGAAIAELRDLARGIAPPVLADRGLSAAVEALAQRSQVPVTAHVDVDRRPLPVLETAAYFVVAEGLTNVAKHAPSAKVNVNVELETDKLVVTIQDNGPGGANADGGGLTGLRHRVEALDGNLRVSSPEGIGTTITAELPCVS
jgi:signal transduction histidine kinase